MGILDDMDLQRELWSLAPLPEGGETLPPWKLMPELPEVSGGWAGRLYTLRAEWDRSWRARNDRAKFLEYLSRHPMPAGWLWQVAHLLYHEGLADEDMFMYALITELTRLGAMVEDIGFTYWRDKFGDEPPAPWAGGRDMSVALWLDMRGLTFFSRWAVEKRRKCTLDSWLSAQAPPTSQPWSLYYEAVRSAEVPASLPRSTLERFAISLGADPYPSPPWSMVTEIPVLVRKGTHLSTFETRQKWLWGSADYRDVWNQWLVHSFDDPATARKYFGDVASPPATWHEWLDCRGVPGSSDPDLSLLGWLQEGS